MKKTSKTIAGGLLLMVSGLAIAEGNPPYLGQNDVFDEHLVGVAKGDKNFYTSIALDDIYKLFSNMTALQKTVEQQQDKINKLQEQQQAIKDEFDKQLRELRTDAEEKDRANREVKKSVESLKSEVAELKRSLDDVRSKVK